MCLETVPIVPHLARLVNTLISRGRGVDLVRVLWYDVSTQEEINMNPRLYDRQAKALISDELYKQLRQLAAQRGVSMSYLIRLALAQMLQAEAENDNLAT